MCLTNSTRTEKHYILIFFKKSKTCKFSVKDEDVAEQLTKLTGSKVTVHYKEYKGALPWRGYEKAVVDSVAEEAPGQTPAAPSPDDFFL